MQAGGIQEHYGKFQDQNRTKVRMNTDGKTWIFRAEIGTGSAGTDDERHHHEHTSARTAISYPLSLPLTAMCPATALLHCHRNTEPQHSLHCNLPLPLSLDHYRPPCGIGKTGLAIELRLPEHQGSIPSIPWKQTYHYQLI